MITRHIHASLFLLVSTAEAFAPGGHASLFLLLNTAEAFAPGGRSFAPATRAANSIRTPPRTAPLNVRTDLTGATAMLELTLPQRSVADMLFRTALYGFRLFAGVGCDGAAVAAVHTRDARLLLTSSTAGAVNSARGVANAWNSSQLVPGMQHASMLVYHPLEICRWVSRVMRNGGISSGSALGASALAAAATRIASSLWLFWIFCTAVLSLRQLATSDAADERHTLRLRLMKLLIDTPISVHFVLGSTLLPLALVGLLGTASSYFGLRAALGDPAKPAPSRLALPLPLTPFNRLRRRSFLWHRDCGVGCCSPIRPALRQRASLSSPCSSPRIAPRIRSSAFSRSSEW